MSRENVKAIRRGYEALNSGDIESAVNLPPDFEFTLPPMLPDVERHSSGGENFKRIWLTWRDQFEDFRIEVEEILDPGDDRVLVMAGIRGIGKGSGAEVRTPSFAQIWTFKDGVPVKMDSFPNRAVAMGELGLGPKVPWE
jgi:ketosteroid isomerase-like protein